MQTPGNWLRAFFMAANKELDLYLFLNAPRGNAKPVHRLRNHASRHAPRYVCGGRCFAWFDLL